MLSDETKSSGGDRRDLELFAKIQVAEVVSSRYDDTVGCLSTDRLGSKPPKWEDRREGIDTIRTTGGEVLRLLSIGGQAVPKPGWVLVITGGSFEKGYLWTLYGIPPAH
jgi:hypothetical protein